MKFLDLNEGPNDPGIFKAIFLAGGPGSGKSYASKKLGLSAHGLKSINSDEAFEYLLQKNDMDMDPSTIASEPAQELRGKAKQLTDLKKQGFLAGRLGVVIDGTAKDPNKILNMKASLEELGYETAMVFVNTGLRTAMQRNLNRKRSVPGSVVADAHKQVQSVLPKLRDEFADNFVEINSDTPDTFDRDIADANKFVNSFMSTPLNSKAKQWVNSAQLDKVSEADADDMKFAHDSDVDIPRDKMPQIQFKHLKDKFRVVRGRLALDKIKPSQSQRVPGLVQNVIDDMYSGRMKAKPLIVDKQGYLVNGHHRLDALKHMGAEKTDVIMVDAKLQDLIDDFSHTASDAFAEEQDHKLLDKPTPTVKQLALKHDVDITRIRAELEKGIKVELEHTSDPKIAKEIALDHINELPDYYTRLATVEENVSFVKPQFDVEWEEANRYDFLDKLGQQGWEELAKTGKAVTVTKNNVKKIGNTGADGSETLDDLEPDKVARLKTAMKSGTVEMPIVMKQPNGELELIAGNTRLIGLINTVGKATVWYIDASKLEENVADGKTVEEGPKDFGDMKLDAKGKQDSIDYFYKDHAPSMGKPVKAGKLGSHDIVTVTKSPTTLMFLVDANDSAVFYVGFEKYQDGVAIGNVRSNGTVKATDVYAYLVKKYGKLYSDKHQTPSGRKIWDNLPKYTKLKVTDVGDRLMATENFADVEEGNKAQLGIPANATDAELRKARKAGGKKGQRAHWLLNMRKGNKK